MFISLDNLASRYGILPSEALSRCSTLDFIVLDIGAKWSNKQYEDQTNDQPEQISTEEMQRRILKAREQQNANS